MPRPADLTPTLGGLLAIALWASTIAFSRSLAEALGTFTAGASVYGLGGLAACAALLASPAARRRLADLPARYLFGCGGLFVAYTVFLYAAVGMARSRQQVLEVGMINYLWPSLTLVLSVPLLGRRASRPFLPGVAVAATGVVLATTHATPLTWAGFSQNLRANAVPYGLALAAAFAWAFYSNLSRRWAGSSEGNPVPLFVLASGAVLALLRAVSPEGPPQWSARVTAELLYMAVLPTVVAYSLWDGAMRRGRVVLVASASYATPLASSAITACYLGAGAGATFWIAAGLVVAGAVVANRSLADP